MWGVEREEAGCDRKREMIKNEPSRHFLSPLLTSLRSDEWIFMPDPDAATQQRRGKTLKQIQLCFWCMRCRWSQSPRSGSRSSCLRDNDSESGDADAAPEHIWTLHSTLNQTFSVRVHVCLQTAVLRTVKAALITSSPPFQLTQHPAAGI